MEQINLTNTLAGLAAIQRCMAGEDILFTRLEIGDGILTNTDVSGMTGLINKTSEFPLGAIQTEDNEVIRLRSNISNKDISEDLVIREYGIYAKFGNEQEFLFAYLNVGESTTPLPNERIGRYELNRDFVLYIGNSTHVDFTSNGNLVYVAVNEYKDDMTRKANVVGTIEDLKNSKKYKIGDVVEVLGYYTPGDGGGHPRQKAPEGYIGEDAIVGVDGSIWKIIHYDNKVNASWLGARGDGITDDTLAIQRAINLDSFFIDLQDKLYFTKRLNLRSGLYIHNGKLINTEEDKVVELLKGYDLNNVTINNLFIDMNCNRTYEKIAIQFYRSTNINITENNFENCNAQFGFSDCSDIFITRNTSSNILQLGTNSPRAGVYGYGVVFVNSKDCLVYGNIFGTQEKPLERHALYVSTDPARPNICCNNIKFFDNIINQVVYENVDSSLTGFEAPLKCIHGHNIYMENNVINGGTFGLLLSYRDNENVSHDNIILRNNIFKNLSTRGVQLWKPEGIGAIVTPSDNILIEGNIFEFKNFGMGIDYANVRNLISRNNHFINKASVSGACYMGRLNSEGNKTIATKITIENDTVENFNRAIGIINNVIDFSAKIKVVNCNPANLFEYNESVTNREIVLEGVSKLYRQRKNLNQNIRYFENDFSSVVMCNSAGDWYSDTVKVSGLLAERPKQSFKGQKYWETDQNRFVYWTGGTWFTEQYIIPDSQTLANIKTIPTKYLGDGTMVYCTDLSKPLYYNPFSQEWRDANANNTNTLVKLDTPYMTQKMQQEGVYEYFIDYMDRKIEYDRLQRELEQQHQLAFEQRENQEQTYEEWLVEQPMMLPVEEEPQPDEKLLEFANKYAY